MDLYIKALALAAFLATAQLAVAADDIDLEAIHKIKDEAFRNSAVMDHMFHLSDRFGPRISESPAYRASAQWAADTMASWGMNNAGLEKFGEFGKGWSLDRYSMHMVEPDYAPISGIPRGWTGSTDGIQRAQVTRAVFFESAEDAAHVRYDIERVRNAIQRYMEKHKGKLAGKVILYDRLRRLDLPEQAEGKRLDDAELAKKSKAPEPAPPINYQWPLKKLPRDPVERGAYFSWIPFEVMNRFFDDYVEEWQTLNRFWVEEGVVAVLRTDRRGSGGTAFAEASGSHLPGSIEPPPIVSLAPEHYGRIYRLVDAGVDVTLELDIQTTFHEDDLSGYNVIAEIPGSGENGEGDEIVMLGGHLDSWHGATGATDNAAGCAVVMEAARILTALDLPMRRTVRVALWGGEEQGLFGSRGYVKEHLGDPVTMELKKEHEAFAGYFNLDNGSGKIRGVYLQGNDMMRPVFESWFGPFRDLGVTTVTIRNTHGTDHLSFDSVGLPGFQFIQDPLEYSTRTHHSNLDDVSHVKEADLMQASAVMASVVYHAANREEKLPRKPLPKPLPPPTGG